MFNKKLSLLVLIVVLLLISCAPDYNKMAQKITADMNINQKIGQLLIVGVKGKNINKSSRKILHNYFPGGIIFFGYNFRKKNQLIEFIDDLQNESMLYSGIPLFITTDQEGGRVRRIVDGVTQFPGNMAMGSACDEKLVYNAAKILGIELRSIGINMNLTPDIDINDNPDNPVINTRSFGSNVYEVSKMGKVYIEGLQDAKCMAVAKHFPGHGNTSKDSHKILPVIYYSLEDLVKKEFIPFNVAIEAGVAGIMSAHIAYPNILNNSEPATISKKFMTDILRKKMRFNGLVMTDDLEMNAIDANIDIGSAAVKALNAGVDIILISSYGDDNGSSIKKIFKKLKEAYIYGEISEKRLNNSIFRIIKAKLKYKIIKYNENGSFELDKYVVNSNDNNFLKQSKIINSKLSEKALYYYSGNDKLLSFAKPISHKGILISNKSKLTDIISNYEKEWEIFSSKNISKQLKKLYKKGSNLNISIYYTIKSDNDKNYKLLQKLQKKYNYKLFLISFSNPFKLTGDNILPPTLFTYSPTEESVIAAARAMLGKIVPKQNTIIDLGIGRSR